MEYKSQKTLLGLPLIHIKGSTYDNGQRHIGIAKGWIAIGDIAISPFLAVGGVAIGLIANGGVCLGLLLALGGLSIGGIAIGGASFGLWAAGGLVVALFAAMGGTAVAVECAVGGLAIAENANTTDALSCINGTFRWAWNWITSHVHWLAILVLIPVVFGTLRKKREVNSQET
jgi:hypothetical protein